MNIVFSNLTKRLAEAGHVSDADVLALRDAVWNGEAISRDMLDALFLVNDRCAQQSPAWIAFFVEAVTHALLDQTPPAGFLDEDGAVWLRARIEHDGRIASLAEMELLVTVLERAENAPDGLKIHALAEIEATVASGAGPTRDAGSARPNCVDQAEVALLRRLIFAGGGEGAIIVGAEEAEMLLRIKDAALDGDNAPGWLPLFVQGLGNHLMAHSDYRPLSRDEAARLHAAMEDATPNVAAFFRRMLPADMLGRGTILDAFKAVFPRAGEDGPARLVPAPGEALTVDEAAWLRAQIVVDDEIDPFEKALLTFILDEAGSLPAPLADLGRRRA